MKPIMGQHWGVDVQLFLRYIKRLTPLLDCGCGQGGWARMLNMKEVYGVDVWKPYLRTAKKLGVYEGLVQADVCCLPFRDHVFGELLAFELLEHLSKSDGFKALTEMQRVCHNQLLLSTPSGYVPLNSLFNVERHKSGWTRQELEELDFYLIKKYRMKYDNPEIFTYDDLFMRKTLNKTAGILFVIDCLREDAYPDWFIFKHKGVLNRFETALNTPMSFNSILLGRNIYRELERQNQLNEKQMFNLYLKPPRGEPLHTRLKKSGVNCYYVSDNEGLMDKHVWWSHPTQMRSALDLEKLERPFFLLNHVFKLHGPTSPSKFYRGNYATRREYHKEYTAKTDMVFTYVEYVLNVLQPNYWAVMGDHGEEFYDEQFDTSVKTVGHGSFKEMVKTDNVRYTKLFINHPDYEWVQDYGSLYSMILDWYER